jgi:hypothetical protein
MRPVAVVVLDVPMDDGFEVASAEDEHPIQTFTSDSADEALSEGVCTGRLDRSSDRPDAIGPKDLVESGSELGVAIADQEFDRPGTLRAASAGNVQSTRRISTWLGTTLTPNVGHSFTMATRQPAERRTSVPTTSRCSRSNRTCIRELVLLQELVDRRFARIRISRDGVH